MQVLIVDDSPERQSVLTMAFTDSGFQAVSTASQAVAEAFIRNSVVDLLVMPERVGGRLTHGLALLAELNMPMVATLMLTSRTDPDADELFLLLPSLHGLLAPDTTPATVVKLAIASMSGASAAATARVELDPDSPARDADEAEGPPLVLEASMRVPDGAPVFCSSRTRRGAPVPRPAMPEMEFARAG